MTTRPLSLAQTTTAIAYQTRRLGPLLLGGLLLSGCGVGAYEERMKVTIQEQRTKNAEAKRQQDAAAKEAGQPVPAPAAAPPQPAVVPPAP